jgi:hypothetical protein
MLRCTKIWYCTKKRATAALQFSHAEKKGEMNEVERNPMRPKRDGAIAGGGGF